MGMMARIKHDDSQDQIICIGTHRLKVLQLEPATALLRLLSLDGAEIWIEKVPRPVPDSLTQDIPGE